MFDFGNIDLSEYGLSPEQLTDDHIGNREECPVLFIDPNQVILYENIRAYDPEHIVRIAASISVEGQLQPCIGDTIRDEDGNEHTRILAGLHRTQALIFLNEQYQKAGREPLRLSVRVYQRELTPYEIFQVQLSENLHKNMTSAEIAESLWLLWIEYKAVSKKPTVAQFAREIGRGVGQVSDALKFSDLDKRVIEIVKAGFLLYSIGVELARLPEELQFQIMVRIIEGNLTSGQSKLLVQRTLNPDDGGHVGPLFNQEEWEELEKEGVRLTMRGAASQAARDASGYFSRILYLIFILPEDQRLELTDTVKDLLAQLIYSAKRFVDVLAIEDPELLIQIDRRNGDVL